MKVALDVFGGDNAPQAALMGARAAKDKYKTDILLCGNREKTEEAAKKYGIDISDMEIADAEGVIGMDDDPMSILKSNGKCSMAVCMKAVANGEADACVSAGSTAALTVGGTFIVKRMQGVKRCALAALIPSQNGFFMLLDCGANAEVKPEYLMQFGIMGSTYMKNVMGIENPRVALLNIGTEECKGTEVHQQAYKLLEDAPLNFIGNIEGREMPYGAADVVVADGFSGNIALKTYEGASMALLKNVKGIFLKNIFTKLAAAMLSGGIKELKKKTDYSAVGGAPLLGSKYPVFKAHGSSNAVAFENAIKTAEIFAKTGVISQIEGNL
ncbi:MAG: phosphate acyltransferase PlsX [Oscillospiraceae bacterium]|nr:phosphate acyltransferase PlsX [Candidatus Equicaccousia limihippi]